MKYPQLTLLLCLLCIGCASDNDLPNPVEDEHQPVLLSTSPAAGATVSYKDVQVELTFDCNILLVNKTKVLLNNQIVGGASASGNKLTVALGKLTPQTDYTLRIGTYGLKADPGTLNEKEFTLSFLTVEAPQPEITQTLCTPNPSTKTVALYDYLRSIYGKQMLSGMMADVAWNTTESEHVYAVTGKYPAINCFDYIFLAFSPANWIDYGNLAPVENWAKAGGIVALMWHWNVPPKAGVTDPEKMSFYVDRLETFRAANAVIDGTWENTVIKADLAKIVVYLKQVRDAGIPVLWRPLHEAAGNIGAYPGGTAWFWWGMDGAEPFKKLWKMMFDYFKAEGLNNLIWVWTGDKKDTDFYPGDDYVDIIGMDIYNDHTTTQRQFDTIQELYPNKMITLSECGAVSHVSEMWNGGARWLWFMPWYGYFNQEQGIPQATDDWWIAAFKNNFVLSRDQVALH